MGKFLFHCIGYRKRLVLSNINQVFQNRLSLQEKKHLAKAYYSHLATSFKEGFQLRFMTEEQLSQQVSVLGHEHMLKIALQNKGVLVLTGHFGNWEYAPLGGILNFKEFSGQFHFIRKTLSIKAFERFLFKNYYKFGLNVIPSKNSLEKVCVALENGHAVIFVMDQHAMPANKDGIAVEFFGKKAGTYRSLATIARYTQIPVVPAAGYRLPNGKHVLEFFPPIEWQDYGSNAESLYQNTLKYNHALERIILANPAQWNWMHKRWKLP